MSENVQPSSGGAGGTGAESQAGRPYYEKCRQELKEMLAKQETLRVRLAQTNEEVYQRETEYLDNTPNGNILAGFDNYLKGGGSEAKRRKAGAMEALRVFSQSSLSYNPRDTGTPASVNSNPASHAPTPLSMSFARDTGSNHPTPTSAGPPGKASTKKSKKNGGEDSEDTDLREFKKARTSVTNASRK